jgi:hypothetical protein
VAGFVVVAMRGPTRVIDPALLMVVDAVFLWHALLFGLLYFHVTRRIYRRWRRVRPAGPPVRVMTAADDDDDDDDDDDGRVGRRYWR